MASTLSSRADEQHDFWGIQQVCRLASDDFVGVNRIRERITRWSIQADARPTATPMAVSASRRIGCSQAPRGLTSATSRTTAVVMAAVIASPGRPISVAVSALTPTSTASAQLWNGRNAR